MGPLRIFGRFRMGTEFAQYGRAEIMGLQMFSIGLK